MQKFSNISIQARHGLERTGLMSRPSPMDVPGPAGYNGNPHGGMGMNSGGTATSGLGNLQIPLPFKRNALPAGVPPMAALTPAETLVNLSFNVPFASTLAGPEPTEILHASPKAVERWTFPLGSVPGEIPSEASDAAPDGLAESTTTIPPIHKLPVHQSNVDQLRRLCRTLSDNSIPRVEAAVTCAEPKQIPGLPQSSGRGLVTNVCVSGDADVAHKMRAKILNETPIALKCASVDIDTSLVTKSGSNGTRPEVLKHIDAVAKYTGSDIFLLNQVADINDTAASTLTNVASSESPFQPRLCIAIYGDPESSEHAKTRILIMIDQILNRRIDILKLEHSLHAIICGRTRKSVRQIEAASNTAIYFPPPFPRVYGYMPPGAHRRGEDEVYITGEDKGSIDHAKRQLGDLVMNTRCFVKDVMVSPSKIDSILLERLDKVRKVMELNGSYVLFPQLGSQRGLIRVQGTEIVHVERTVREIMALAGQFYSASWWLLDPPSAGAGGMRAPLPADIRKMLSDICTNSGAEVGFEKLIFTITGSDETVKAAMMIIQQIPFVKRAHYQIRIKLELANEHKEFISGKKNGKINKIMGQSNVQIIFDGFNEYNFHIDVCGAQYEAARNGLDLVEQEMPASISFHVPDQYHKRIIGIGGQHIQRIMKRYSVFVKFSNALDRSSSSNGLIAHYTNNSHGGNNNANASSSARHVEDVKMDNVVCRTPARNAQALDQVKQDIMDMVEKVDAEFVSEKVIVDRLYHRHLITQLSRIEELEHKWNCKIDFPATELASDAITISGPEYQVPQAVDEFLGMIPESHEIVVPSSSGLAAFIASKQFEIDLRDKLKNQYEVNLQVPEPAHSPNDGSKPPAEHRFLLQYTRNNAGGLKDAVDFLVTSLIPHGLDAATVKGSIPRPKSDSFEDSLPFFDSKLLHNVPTPVGAGSPTHSTFAGAGGDDASDRGSLFGKIRKPGSISSISSFLDRRRNTNNSTTSQQLQPGQSGHDSTSSFFKHASSNASRASLISMESRESGYRNPWNDSGVSLPEGDETVGSGGWPLRFDNQSAHSLHSLHSLNKLDSLPPPASISAVTNSAPVSGLGATQATTLNVPTPPSFLSGSTTPRHEHRTSGSISGSVSAETGRPSTCQSATGLPNPIAPPKSAAS